MLSTRTGAAGLLVGAVICLIIFKVVVALITGSISIFAQASDSLLDLFAGIVTLSAVRIAVRPADEVHPYGHGKVEDVAGAIQGILIIGAGGLIIYSAIRRMLEGAIIELPEAGIGVMLFSIAVSIVLSRYLFRVARATGSVALEANAYNIAADVYSASAVTVGLLLVRLTGITYIDSIIAVAVAVYIVFMARKPLLKSIAGLADARLSHDEENVIRTCVEAHSEQIAGFHQLRTRRSGSQRHVDLHLVMDKEITVDQAHQTCDKIESEIRSKLPQASVTIHIEPCDDACEQCYAICSRRQTKGVL